MARSSIGPTRRVTFCIPVSQRRELERIAKANDRTLSGQIRRIVRLSIEK